jgi:HD-GYP domain-containing protein (c-di-GMP phosphodiesterase class II)
MSEPEQRPNLAQILASDLRAFVDDILHQEGGIDHFRQLLTEEQLSTLESRRKLDLVTRAGISFSREPDIANIMETTLNTARGLTNADGGTIYMVEELFTDNPIDPGEIAHRELKFVCLQNESMNTHIRGEDIDLMPPVPMEIDGEDNLHNVSAYCANTGELLNFADVYHADGFDFSGTRSYDKANGYRSRSMLVIPLEDHENSIIGVLQLINRRKSDGSIGEFTREDIELVESVSYPAAAAITTQRLIGEQVNLFNSFVTLLAEGLGEKSPHTYNHIRRVAALGEAISESLNNWSEGIYRDVAYNADEMAEIRLAGWLHDIGKMTTPEHIVAKQVKLQLVMDRFELIVERANSLAKDYRIEQLEQQLQATRNGAGADALLQAEHACSAKTEALAEKLQALLPANRGGEAMPEQQIALVRELANTELRNYFSADVTVNHGYPVVSGIRQEEGRTALVDAAEEENLLIAYGTLNQQERRSINNHADRSWRWLMALPFPRKQKRLPLYAGAHHEHLNGTGYPNGIDAAAMPMQSRILAIADIYEALIANDRPYKQPMKLSVATDIIGQRVKRGELDAELVRIFLVSGDYLSFAAEHMDPDQIDRVDVEDWLRRYYVTPVPPGL